MAEKTNVPEIRFAGFTDPWEQRKLGELFAESDERSSTEEILSVSVANGIYPASESDRDTNPGASIANYKIVRVGDIVYNSMRMWQGAVGSSRYNGIVSPAYVVARPIFELDSTCFGYLLKRPEMLHKYLCDSQGNSKDTQTLRYERFAEIAAEVPSTIEEQRAISDCLNGLDSLITLHQRKYDKLCAVKKSMLDKMFPKPGETKPEIRFDGFTDPWEQRKLGELLLFQNGFNGSSESFGSGVPLISVMDVLDDEFITHETVRGKARLNCEEASRYCVEYGDVLFQRSSENQEDAGTSNVYLDQHVSSAFGGFVIRGKKVGEYNPIFIKYLLGSSSIREQITHRAQGAQHINVSQDTLADVVLLMPSMREQEAVGLVFLHLDSLITLHQRKLNLLRNTKKSLLEKMFV